MKITLFTVTRFTGLGAALGLVVLWALFASSAPPAVLGGISEPQVIAVAMAILALIIGIFSLAEKALVVIIGSLLSFVPIGLYLLGTPSVFRLIGVLDLVALAAGAILLVQPKGGVRRA